MSHRGDVFEWKEGRREQGRFVVELLVNRRQVGRLVKLGKDHAVGIVPGKLVKHYRGNGHWIMWTFEEDYREVRYGHLGP